jgi:hypothetical protein
MVHSNDAFQKGATEVAVVPSGIMRSIQPGHILYVFRLPDGFVRDMYLVSSCTESVSVSVSGDDRCCIVVCRRVPFGQEEVMSLMEGDFLRSCIGGWAYANEEHQKRALDLAIRGSKVRLLQEGQLLWICLRLSDEPVGYDRAWFSARILVSVDDHGMEDGVPYQKVSLLFQHDNKCLNHFVLKENAEGTSVEGGWRAAAGSALLGGIVSSHMLGPPKVQTRGRNDFATQVIELMNSMLRHIDDRYKQLGFGAWRYMSGSNTVLKAAFAVVLSDSMVLEPGEGVAATWNAVQRLLPVLVKVHNDIVWGCIKGPRRSTPNTTLDKMKATVYRVAAACIDHVSGDGGGNGVCQEVMAICKFRIKGTKNGRTLSENFECPIVY